MRLRYACPFAAFPPARSVQEAAYQEEAEAALELQPLDHGEPRLDLGDALEAFLTGLGKRVVGDLPPRPLDGNSRRTWNISSGVAPTGLWRRRW